MLVNREPIEHMDIGQSMETTGLKSNLDFQSICAGAAFVWQDPDPISGQLRARLSTDPTDWFLCFND